MTTRLIFLETFMTRSWCLPLNNTDLVRVCGYPIAADNVAQITGLLLGKHTIGEQGQVLDREVVLRPPALIGSK